MGKGKEGDGGKAVLGTRINLKSPYHVIEYHKKAIRAHARGELSQVDLRAITYACSQLLHSMGEQGVVDEQNAPKPLGDLILESIYADQEVETWRRFYIDKCKDDPEGVARAMSYDDENYVAPLTETEKERAEELIDEISGTVRRATKTDREHYSFNPSNREW